MRLVERAFSPASPGWFEKGARNHDDLDAALKAPFYPETALTCWTGFTTLQRGTSIISLNAAGDDACGIARHDSSRRHITEDNRSERNRNHVS
jgi:hypothetical protein